MDGIVSMSTYGGWGGGVSLGLGGGRYGCGAGIGMDVEQGWSDLGGWEG